MEPQVFQEKYVVWRWTGWRFKRWTYYTYCKFLPETGMVPVRQYPQQTIEAVERGK